jgi:hypothetical protein
MKVILAINYESLYRNQAINGIVTGSCYLVYLVLIIVMHPVARVSILHILVYLGFEDW